MAEALHIRHPSPLLLISILLGLVHVYTLAYHDYSPIPVFKIVQEAVGLTQTHVVYIWYFAVAAHTFESLVALVTCLKRGYPITNTLTWFALTFVFGYGYLGRVLKGHRKATSNGAKAE